MLILPDAGAGVPLPIGSSCRICPRAACPARREPSILAIEGAGA
jgi:predicted transcriptional regulator